MTEDKQSKPFTPSRNHIRSDEEVGFSSSEAKPKNVRQRKYMIKCVGGWLTGILFLAVLITVLMLTVFRVKEPEINMYRITIPQFSLDTLPSTIKILAEMTIKNPNMASFKYDNSTTLLYYHGNKVGEAHNPKGMAKARRTRNMDLAMEIVSEQVLRDPKFLTEFASGLITVTSYTRLDGRVRIIKIIKKHVVVTMNCTMTANITSQDIVAQKCKQKISL